ncbi:MAG: hypothetical protein HYY31_02340 [Chloroflexi bacterium]|nr:hypothetical protein [Chloroflexota bacterium]
MPSRENALQGAPAGQARYLVKLAHGQVFVLSAIKSPMGKVPVRLAQRSGRGGVEAGQAHRYMFQQSNDRAHQLDSYAQSMLPL